MADWHTPNRSTSFRYVRVSWPDFREVGELEGVTSCTIDESQFTALRVSGSLDYIDMPEIGDDLVRIYSDSVWEDGSRETVCHGTLFVSRPKDEVTDGVHEGTAELYSTLLVMRQIKCEETYTVAQGAVATDEVKALIEACGLTAVVTPSDTVTTTSHSWTAGTEYVEIANDLLDKVGYEALTVDAYGNVLVAPYVEPLAKAAAATLSDTEDSVGARQFEHEFDDYEVPNVVVLTYSNSDNEVMIATAVNSDPDNRYSTAARGRRICRYEEVDEIASQAALNEKAQELLKTSMMLVESIEVPHSWLPYEIGDAVQFDYQRSDTQMKLSAATRTTTMTPDIACQTRLRRFVNLLEDE